MTHQLLNMTEASLYVGLSRATLWRIIREYNITTYPDARDKRAVCVRREDIEQYRKASTSSGLQAA